MDRYIDGLDLPRRRAIIAGEFKDGDLGNFVGIRCGIPVFYSSRETVNHLTTGEIVGYCSAIQIGCGDRTDSSIRYKKITEYFLEYSNRFSRKEDRQNLLADVGSAVLKSSALAGVTGGLLEWFNYSPEISLTGAVVAVAIGGLKFVNSRRKIEEDFRSYIEEFSDYLSSMDKATISVNLLAPDSCIDEDSQTGSPDNRQSSNVYLIGDMPIDQQRRADRFWRRADKILGEYGFAELQGYESAGMSALLQRILDDVDGDDTFNYDEKSMVGDAIKSFVHCRESAVSNMQQLQGEVESKKVLQQYDAEHPASDKKKDVAAFARGVLLKLLGHKDDAAQVGFAGLLPGNNPQKILAQQIGNIDRQYREDFRGFVTELREAVILSKRRTIQTNLIKTYGAGSDLQRLFWGELSEILARNDVDMYDESVSRPVQFILDLPKMVSQEDIHQLSSTGELKRLYGIFRRICSKKYPDIETSTTFLGRYVN